MPGDGEDMSDESSLNKIEFDALPVKVQTMATDNTIRITLDLNENETMVMAKVAECIRFGARLHIKAIPETTDDKPRRTKSY
jgi:hypothetical protein